MYNTAFGTVKTINAIRKICSSSNITNGIPFKKGWPVPVGTETITQLKGSEYIRVKVAEPNKWQYKHYVVWESVYGSVPKWHMLIFIDGNTKNTDINNLRLISKQENAVLSNFKLRSKNPDLLSMGITIADIHLAINERLRKAKTGGQDKPEMEGSGR